MSMLTLATSIGLIAAFAIVFPRITKGLSARLNLLIACGYLVLLIGLSAVCLMIPASSLVWAETPTISDGYVHYDNAVWSNLFSGNFSAPDGLTQTVTSLKPQSKTIAVKGLSNFYNVWVGRKGVNAPDNHNGKIDIYRYSEAPISYANYKYHPKPPLLKYTYKGSLLEFRAVPQSNYVVYSFDDRLSAEQFYTESNSLYYINSYELVVVLLPKGVKISGGDYSSYPTY